MNTKYGRLKNGQIEYAPVSLDTGDGVKMNPSEASYLAAGWKKVVDVMPTVEAGHRAVVSGWREDADTLTCVYKVVAGETPVASARSAGTTTTTSPRRTSARTTRSSRRRSPRSRATPA